MVPEVVDEAAARHSVHGLADALHVRAGDAPQQDGEEVAPVATGSQRLLAVLEVANKQPRILGIERAETIAINGPDPGSDGHSDFLKGYCTLIFGRSKGKVLPVNAHKVCDTPDCRRGIVPNLKQERPKTCKVQTKLISEKNRQEEQQTLPRTKRR